MTAPSDRPILSPAILSLLAALRRRIRLYILLEGLVLAVLWLGAVFWAGLAIDYLPVLAGASEMPRWARATLLAVAAAVLAAILYRWILRRLAAPLANPSMALLLERRFDRFEDALVTAVEMSERPDHAAPFRRDMLARVNEEAASKLRGVRLFRIFNLSPLALRSGAAALLILSILLFYAANAQAFEIWMRRLTLLSDRPWPRKAHIETVGVRIEPSTLGLPNSPPPRLLPFQNGAVKVGKGAHVHLVVSADAAKVVPDTCTIYYLTADRERGRASMKKIGRPRNGLQIFEFDGNPFQSVLADVRFDVVGYDYRIRNRRIRVVDNPVVVRPTAYCVFPDYMVNQQLSSWLPRTVALDNATKLPQGTELTIRAESNKPLREARLYNPDTRKTALAELQGPAGAANRLQYHVPQLDSGGLTLEITLLDVDSVRSPRPLRIRIDAIADQPPDVQTTLDGIGTAVTPDVVVPVRGEIRDDYGVADAWLEVRHNDQPPRRFPLHPSPDGPLEDQVDFRDERARPDGLQLAPGGKLIVQVKASDRFDLADQPHVGAGDAFQLDVVTPDQLLARLEARELALRQRLELIIGEVAEMRDSLVRVQSELEGRGAAGAEPEDAADRAPADNANSTTTPPADSQTPAQRALALRQLRVQQAQRQSEKSAQEILGVAAAFQDIRQELINNRIDTEDRKERLQKQIAEPLQQVGQASFPVLDQRLAALETALNRPSPRPETAAAAVQQADDILLQLDQILQHMLELETFNELVGIVRSLIDDQQTLQEKTKQLRKKQALDFLQGAGPADR